MEPAAVVFDLFGTLLEIASLETAAAAHTAEPAAFVTTWREKQLAYAFAATIMERYEDFDALTLRALRYAAAKHHLDTGNWETLAGAWRAVRPYDDAADALGRLRAAGRRCAVLTNGTLATAHAALASAGLATSIDTVLSVDAVRAYKPDARVYASAAAHFAVPPGALVFVTSNGWDATGAAEFGLRVVWCNRAEAPPETFGVAPARTIVNLAALPEAVSALG
jgi:2-haloacid dehalogenase